MKLQWTATARREFDEAFDGLYEVSPENAGAWRRDIHRMIEMLEDFPRIGRHHRNDPDGEIREVIVGRYRFVYRVTDDVIEMRRVLHVRRDYDVRFVRDGGAGAFA